MGAAISTTGINTSAIKALQAAKVIRQAANLVKVAKFVGKPGDDMSPIYVPLPRFEKGGTVDVPLRRVDTGSALTPGYTYEEQGDVIPFSTSKLTLALRGRPFQAPGEYETMKSVIDARAQLTKDAWEWEAADIDRFIIEGLRVTTPQSTFPERSARRPTVTTSQYLVEYLGDAASWTAITAADTTTGSGLSRAKRYFQKNGVRMARFGGMSGYLVWLPLEATMDLQDDPEFVKKATWTLPRSEDHPFWTGFGDEFFARYDGMWLFQDLRPAFGGTDTTFLYTDESGDYMKYEGVFLGAQGCAYYKQKGPIYFERLWNHDQNFENSVRTYDGIVKTVLNLGAINDTSNIKDYGLGYICGAAKKLS